MRLYCRIIALTVWTLMSCVVKDAAFEFVCPHPSQRNFRAAVVCKDQTLSQYYCLWNQHLKHFTESCSQPADYVRPGQKYIISGYRRNVNCSSNKYQPFKFWSNLHTECAVLKSLCNEQGQVTINNGSTVDDSRCRCDYRKGYDYIIKPADICFCIPSIEDCTCYKKKCPDSTILSPDYQCISETTNNTTYHCTGIYKYWNDRNATVNTETITEVSQLEETYLRKFVPVLIISIVGVFTLFTAYYLSIGVTTLYTACHYRKSNEDLCIIVRQNNKKVDVNASISMSAKHSIQLLMTEFKKNHNIRKWIPPILKLFLEATGEECNHFIRDHDYHVTVVLWRHNRTNIDSVPNKQRPDVSFILEYFKQDLIDNMEPKIVIDNMTENGLNTPDIECCPTREKQVEYLLTFVKDTGIASRFIDLQDNQQLKKYKQIYEPKDTTKWSIVKNISEIVKIDFVDFQNNMNNIDKKMLNKLLPVLDSEDKNVCKMIGFIVNILVAAATDENDLFVVLAVLTRCNPDLLNYLIPDDIQSATDDNGGQPRVETLSMCSLFQAEFFCSFEQE